MSLSCTVYKIWRDIGRKSPILTYIPPVFGTPLGVTPLKFRRYFRLQKIRVLVMGFRTALFT